MVVVGLAIITALSLALVPSVAQASGPLSPPVAGAADMPIGQLPHCSDITALRGDPILPLSQLAADLGWGPGKPTFVYNVGQTAAQYAPMIPCANAQAGYPILVPILSNLLQGTSMYGQSVIPITVAITCKDVNGVDFTGTGSDMIGSSYTALGVYAGSITTSATTDSCVTISKVVLTMCGGGCSFQSVALKAVWAPTSWTSSNGGFSPAGSLAEIVAAGGASSEAPIVCGIDNTGADIFAITQHVVASIVNWVPCMLIPIGWDRADKITAAWTSGPVGQLVAAYKAAVPSGISCGSVGAVPFYGRTISLDTCQADFAPGLVKTVVGWVIVLGVCALIVRRIMWSVGSKA